MLDPLRNSFSWGLRPMLDFYKNRFISPVFKIVNEKYSPIAKPNKVNKCKPNSYKLMWYMISQYVISYYKSSNILQIEEWLNSTSYSCGSRCLLESIGRSWEGRELWVMKVRSGGHCLFVTFI